jgi:hypothetical protein
VHARLQEIAVMNAKDLLTLWATRSMLTLISLAADAELVRQICVRHFKSFPDRSMFYPPQDPTVNKVFAQGITFSK